MPLDPMMQTPAPDPGAGLPAAPPPPPKFYNVTVRKRTSYGCAKVMSVPPEEWGVASTARCVRDADYCCHSPPRAVHELLSDGFDPDQIMNLPSYGTSDYTMEVLARNSVNQYDDTYAADNVNKMSQMVDITEHYIRMDYEGDGTARLYKITTAGDAGEILRRRKDDDSPYEDDIEEVDAMPFAVMTPVPIPHRVIGRSIADLTMPTQKIKTAALRALLDNFYLTVNPRPEVGESGMTDNTLDDLLTWRPGAPIRTRQVGTIAWQQIPPIGNQVYPLMEYMDSRTEMSTGVSRSGQGLDANVLQNMTAQAAGQMFSMSQARMKLIARIFAETGIRDLFLLLHQVIRKNDRVVNTVRLRGTWVPVDPRQWKTRTDMTVNVGLGTGGKDQKMAFLNQLGLWQEKLMQDPTLNLVDRNKIFNTATEFLKLGDYKNPEKFFNNPQTTQPGQPPPDPKMQIEQQKMQFEAQKAQMQMQHEAAQAQADVATNNNKVQGELMLKQKEFEHKAHLEVLGFQLDAELKRQQSAEKAARDAEHHQLQMQMERERHSAGLQAQANDSASLAAEIRGLKDAYSRPRMIKRGRDGRVEGLH